MNIEPHINHHSLIEIRHYLHQHPELSGQEQHTADYIAKQLYDLNPDELYQGIAATGVAAVFDSGEPGKTLLFRSELDALPIQETHGKAFSSLQSGISHQCGHDGHMCIVLGLAKAIANHRPNRGKVVTLFQPAEETGEGGRAVADDILFKRLNIDECYALHNLPRYPMGQVMTRSGTFSCASRGMIIRLSGRTAHAAYPETGISPQLALANLLQEFDELPKQLPDKGLKMITVVHCDMGEEAFGTSPADACLMATLRTEKNENMQQLVSACTQLAEQVAKDYQLQISIDWSDIFDASVNDADCVAQVVKATQITGNTFCQMDEPFRWSEDFGAMTSVCRGAMFALGAGENSPQIHNPDYVFADELIEQGKNIFFEIYKQLL